VEKRNVLLVILLTAFVLFLSKPANITAQAATDSTNSQPLTQGQWETACVRIADIDNPGHCSGTIRYKISTGQIGYLYYDDMSGKKQIVTEVTAEPWFHSLSFNIISNSSGTLVLELPRTVIDSRNNLPDAPFTVVFVYPKGGVFPTVVHELNSTADKRVIMVNFPFWPSNAGYTTDIGGTYIMPEFGSFAPVSLAMAIVGVLFLTIKSRRLY